MFVSGCLLFGCLFDLRISEVLNENLVDSKV